MRRWWRILAVIAGAGLFFGSALLLRQPPDPVFAGRPASEWAQQLLSSDYSTRNEAQAVFVQLGEMGVPQLRVLVQRRSSPLQPLLLEASRRFSFVQYRPVDPILSNQRGAETLGLVGSNSIAAVPDLIDLLGQEATAPEAERALIRIGRTSVGFLRQAIGHDQPEVRHRVVRLLKEIPPLEPESVRAILLASRDKDAGVRKQAASSLGGILDAAGTGSRQLPLFAEIRATLLSLAQDEVPEVRAAGIQALGHCPPDSRIAEVLSLALHDSDLVVRLESAKALWRMEQDAASILPTLVSILDTRESWQAAYALADMKERASPAVPALVRALQREIVPRPYRTPPSSAFALGQIGPAALDSLMTVLDHPQPRVRISAVMAIGFMGKKGRSAAPELIKLLGDENAEVRHTTALALAAIGAEPEHIVAALSECLRAEDIYMRSAAATHLRRISPDADWAIAPE